MSRTDVHSVQSGGVRSSAMEASGYESRTGGGLPRTTVAPPASPSRYRTPLVAIVLGVVAFVISWWGSWIPSFWGDEAASIMSAERPWASLLREVQHVDAVHGTYYALLHIWIEVFGATQFSTRFASALAVGVAAAGIVVLVNRLGGLRLAVTSALIFAVLPRTTYMGAEVRSYALGTACAVWLTVLFVRLVTRRAGRALPWIGFAVAFAACIYVFLYLSLLALVYAATLLWIGRGRIRATARAVSSTSTDASPETTALATTVRRWLVSTLAGAVLAAPIIVLALTEQGQIAFLGRHPGVDFRRFIVTQWFDTDTWLAVVAWLALAGVAAWGIVPLVRRGQHDRALLPVLVLAWAAIPPLVLLALNSVVPAYTVRYMSYVTPAIAILLAIGVNGAAGWIARRWSGRRAGIRVTAIAVGIACIAALAAPTYLAQRGPYAKNGGSDWAEVAATVQAHSKPGDDIVFDESTRPSRDPHLALHLYPEQFKNVVDVRLKTSYVDTDGLWDTTYSIPQVAGRLNQGDGRVWLVEYRGTDREGVVSSVGMHNRIAQLQALGFRVADTYRLHRDAVYLLTRGSSS